MTGRTLTWAAGALGLVLGAVARAAPPNLTPPPQYLQTGALSPIQAQDILDAYRQAGPARPFYLEFNLRHMPRRGPEQTYRGRLWASRNGQGAVFRVEIDGGPRLLLQNGRDARVWRSTGGPAEVMPALEPLMPNLEVTAFDLQQPYLYWELEGPVTVTRVRERPADVFIFRAPQAGFAPLTAVRADLDSEYHAPVEVESLGANHQALKTFSLIDLKKVGADWLPKDFDVRDEATRNKSRFTMTGAAMGLDLTPGLFEPGSLERAATPPEGVSRW